MKPFTISKEELEQINLFQLSKNNYLFGNLEDIRFNQKTNNLYYHNCINGDLILYRKVKDFEDLKNALYEGFR
jgi:hypothetical protein